MADRKSQELSESLVDGFLQYDYVETWQVEASGIADALSDADLPQIGQPYLISGTSATVYCFRRQPRRRSDTQAKGLFDVVCQFTNATARYDRTSVGFPSTEPEQIVPRVDIAFEEYNELSPTAQFIGIFDQATGPSGYSPGLSRAVPPYMQTPEFGVEAPIVNSANDPVQNVNKRSHTKRITYWSWHRDWESNWDDFLDKVNTGEVTITQSDSEGQRLRYAFEPYTLLINDIIKEDHWRDGKLYFRRGVVFSHNPKTWFIVLPDQGYNEMLFVNQLYIDYRQITSADMDGWFGTERGQYEHSPIVQYKPNIQALVSNGVAPVVPVPPAEPQALNGYGRLVKYPTPDSPQYLHKKLVYLNYAVADFSTLGIQ